MTQAVPMTCEAFVQQITDLAEKIRVGELDISDALQIGLDLLVQEDGIDLHWNMALDQHILSLKSDNGDLAYLLAVLNYEFANFIEDAELITQCAYTLSDIAKSCGDLQKAEELLQERRYLLQVLDRQSDIISTTLDLAHLYLEKGEKDKAEKECFQALDLAEKTEDVPGKIAALHALAIFYEFFSDDKGAAIKYYEQVLKLIDGKNETQYELSIIDQLIDLYHGIGQFKKTEELCARALKLSHQLGNIAASIQQLRNLGQLSLEDGRNDRAIN